MARRALPSWALSACASCKRTRGNVTRQGWARILDGDGATIGWTCPECPTWDEPIRRVEQSGIVRFKATMDSTPTGVSPRRQVARRCKTLAEAREFVREVRAVTSAGNFYGAEAPVGVEADRSAETFDQLAQRWLDTYQGVRANTRQGYAVWLSYPRRQFGNRDVSTLTTGDVRELVAWMHREGGRRGQGLSNTTIADAIKASAMVLDLALEEGAVVSNAARARSIKLPRVSRSAADADADELDYWPTSGSGDLATIPHMATFRDTADLDPLAAFWRISLCGVTRSEVLGLKWDDLDLDLGEVTIRRGRTPLDSGGSVTDDPKSDARYRSLPIEELHPGTVRLLRALSAKQAADRLRAGQAWTESGYVAVDALGRGIVPRTYSDRFGKLCVVAGVPRIKLHNVRHSLAQLMIERRIPLDVAAAILGHTLAVFMTKYVRQSPRDRIKEHARPIIRAA